MIACGPGFRGGEVIDDLVSLIDLPPTILAAGGVEKPPSMRGRPLQELLGGAPDDWPREVFLQVSESQVGRAIRTKRWKYAVSAPDKNPWTDAAGDRYTEEFLYDLEADPHERNNLVTETAHDDVRRELRERLIARMVAAGEAAPEIAEVGG
jgi:arylsulfatase A-like enzyme